MNEEPSYTLEEFVWATRVVDDALSRGLTSFNRPSWRGYTRKVGLRKSRLHFDALRLRRTVRQVWTDDDFIWAAEHLNECRQPLASLDAALADWRTVVAVEPAEPEPSCPHCPCTQTTECCYCDGTRTPLEDS